MDSGISKKPNALILTNFLSKDGSSQMVKDIVKSLQNDYNVDLLTKYPQEIEGISVYTAYNKYEEFIHKYYGYLKNKILQISQKVIKSRSSNISVQYYFFGLDEKKPPVNSNRILKKIRKEYDFIFVFFWQDLFTSKTLKDIYSKIEKPLLLVAADMFPMTGGCSYFWDCNRLVQSCGYCPGISSITENDSTRENFLFKKKMLESINCIFLGNTWQINHARKSGLFKHYDKIYPIVDENVFKRGDKIALKEKFNLSNKVVLFFGSVGLQDPRKGFEYLQEALKLLAINRPDLRKKIVLMVAGKGDSLVTFDNYEIRYTGYLSFNELAEHYALADVFLSPTIQDAGPMMLNQSLMCGTPAVAFNIGTACDIINEDTGYLAKYRDSTDFCNGIIKLITKSEFELEKIAEICRNQSLERSSYEAFRKDVVNAYNKIK